MRAANQLPGRGPIDVDNAPASYYDMKKCGENIFQVFFMAHSDD